MNQSNTGNFKFLEYSANLKEQRNGLWVTKEQSAKISYPESHHDILLKEQETSFWYDHRKRCLALVLEEFPTLDLLDVGGSNGLLARHLSKVNNVSVLEPHAAGIGNALALGINPVIHADFKMAGFQQDSIPAIGLFDVLEHIEDDLVFLNEVQRTLEPGGRLYLTVPAYNALWSEFDVKVGHFRRYNREYLEEQLKSAGMKIEYFTYIFSPLPLPIWLKRVIGGKKRAKETVKSHYSKKGVIGRFMKLLLSPEIFMIRNQKSIPFGSSCLCIATKSER